MAELTMLLHNSPVNGNDFRLRFALASPKQGARSFVGKETISLWNQPETAD